LHSDELLSLNGRQPSAAPLPRREAIPGTLPSLDGLSASGGEGLGEGERFFADGYAVILYKGIISYLL
jgi:hypothetical protein